MQTVSPIRESAPAKVLSAEQAMSAPRQAPVASAPPRAAVPAPPVANPSVRFDARLGLVVVEFLDDQGNVANSAPTPRQIKAYESGLGMRSLPVPSSQELPVGAKQDSLAVVA